MSLVNTKSADYEDMIGFSNQDIYFAGYTFTGGFNTKFHSLIVHYDGKNFHQEEIPESEGVLSHIWVEVEMIYGHMALRDCYIILMELSGTSLNKTPGLILDQYLELEQKMYS